MRLIIVHGLMNNIYHNSSYMINIDHCMKVCWSCSATVDHCHERLLILHDHWYTTLLIMYHSSWSCHERPLIIHEKLIIAMKPCWSCITTVDHLSYRDHYVALNPAQLGGLHTLILSCCYTLKISHLLLCPQDSVFNHCTESWGWPPA